MAVVKALDQLAEDGDLLEDLDYLECGDDLHGLVSA